MNKKELKNYRSKSQIEIREQIKEARIRLNNLRFDLASGKVKNIKEIRSIRKFIARLLTIEKENLKNNKQI